MTSWTIIAGATEPLHEGARGSDVPRVLFVRTVHEGWRRFLVARLRLGDGSEIEREVEDHGVAVAVLPSDPERREALLVRQLRPPALLAAGLTTMLEAPAGRLSGVGPRRLRGARSARGMQRGTGRARACRGKLVHAGCVSDMKIALLVHALRHRHPALFTR